MGQSEDLYFIAVVPPEDIREEVRELKEKVAEIFNSNHALRSPAHITLHMPFKRKTERITEIHERLFEVGCVSVPFDIQLRNFGFFEPRVVFISVEESQPLHDLRKKVVSSLHQVGIYNADYKDRPFHPHMTIAFRDLRKAQFLRARNFFEHQVYSRSFRCNSISLLKHNGRTWDIHKNFDLSQDL